MSPYKKVVINQNLTIEALASDLGKPDNIHNPRWFDKCVPIAKSFSYDHFGHIALVEASESEKHGSPTGTYYINDGAHKSLVLSTLLLQKKVVFQPVEAMLLTPRD